MQQTVTQSIFEQMEIEQPALFYATNRQRFLSFLIDTAMCLVLYFLVIIAIVIIMAVNGKPEYEIEEWGQNRLDTTLISTVVTIVYFFLLEGLTKGKTLGKLIMGTQAVKEDSSPITWKDAFIRSVSRCVPFEQFSIFGDRIWHDKWSKTMVVKRQKHLIV